MANEYISPFQKYTPKDWKGLTTQNNLAQMYMIEPYLMDKLIRPIFSVNDSADEWMKFVNQFPEIEVPTERPLEWMLIGRSEKNIPLLFASLTLGGSAITAADMCGKGKARFYCVFPEDYFDPDHVIVGEDTDLYSIRVVEKTVLGNQYWLTCELVANNLNSFIPYDKLAANKRFSIDYTLTEQTMSKRGTGMSHTSPFRMSVEMSTMRKQYEVPGSMIDEGKNNPLAFNFFVKDPKTGVTKEETIWINKADYDFRMQLYREISRLLIFGKSNRMNDGTYYNTGSSGYQIKAGPGLREQIAPANILRENKFNLQFFIDWLRQLSFGKLPEDKRKFAVITGEWGFADFTREIENIPNVVQKQYAYGFGLGQKMYKGDIGGLTYQTPQYVKYIDIQGIEIYLIHNPMYDDFVRNKKYHPTEPGLLESRRMTVIDFGTENGESNIVRLRPKGRPSEFWGYIPGLRDPFSPGGTAQNPKLMASPVDGYEIHTKWEGGIAIKNPMRCGELIIDAI